MTLGEHRKLMEERTRPVTDEQVGHYHKSDALQGGVVGRIEENRQKRKQRPSRAKKKVSDEDSSTQADT